MKSQQLTQEASFTLMLCRAWALSWQHRQLMRLASVAAAPATSRPLPARQRLLPTRVCAQPFARQLAALLDVLQPLQTQGCARTTAALHRQLHCSAQHTWPCLV